MSQQTASVYSCGPEVLSHVQLFAAPWTLAHETPLSRVFSQEEHYSGLPFPPPGDLSHPTQGIEPGSPTSPALQADSLQLSHLGNPKQAS